MTHSRLYINDEQPADTSMNEAVEKHDTLNPKLWNEDNTLKPEVEEKINLIVKNFLDGLENDGIKIKVDDIKLVGSNASYNWNPNSDLDVHIVADTNSLECPDNLYPLLYSAYRSIWNGKYDIEFYGIPVELFVETSDTQQMSDPAEAELKEDLDGSIDFSIKDEEYAEELNQIKKDCISLDLNETLSYNNINYKHKEIISMEEQHTKIQENAKSVDKRYKDAEILYYSEKIKAFIIPKDEFDDWEY